ncbi:hypothetical protein RRG08_065330 [Elysia crispata]|uniref:Solute carrier family 46 member 3 n=1 Tax=Elysia crispata TaxID=231223 RepID=A0AAE1D0D8_9GAST|nr:hypothetical protein RRG08_065330 [Elysia crispata]
MALRGERGTETQTDEMVTPTPNTVLNAKVKNASIKKVPFGLINTFIIVFTLADRNRMLLLNHYLYNRLAKDVFGNITFDTTSEPCVNETDPTTSNTDADRVQSMTSSVIMKFDITASVLEVFAVLFLGTFSTSLGRKAQLLIPISGYTVRALSILAVALWDLDLAWLYVGCVAEGLMGGKTGIYLAAYLYVSDITPRNKKRTLGMSLLEGIRGIMGSAINILSGQMIQRTTFIVPALFTACGSLICLLMATLMPNHMQMSEKWSKDILRKSWRTLISPFLGNKDKRVKQMMIVASAVYVLGFSTIYSLDRIRLLYLMYRPFCWSAINIGWYQFGRQAIFNMSIIILIPLCQHCLLGVSLAVVGAAASVAEYILYAFANNNTHLYVALPLSFGQGFPLNLIRGETSRLFGTEKQGPLFACMAVLESISFAVGIFMMSIYTMSLGFFTGLSFLVFAAMILIVLILLCIFQFLWKDYNKSLIQQEKLIPAKLEGSVAAALDAKDDTNHDGDLQIREGTKKRNKMDGEIEMDLLKQERDIESEFDLD